MTAELLKKLPKKESKDEKLDKVVDTWKELLLFSLAAILSVIANPIGKVREFLRHK